MHLFIDTNIFLNFYHYSASDIEELKKLAALIDSGEIVLYAPEQLIDEMHRNRDNKISDAMKIFAKVNFSLAAPAFCKPYDEFDELQALLKQVNMKHSALCDKIKADVAGNFLNADHIISQLLEKSVKIPTSDDLYLAGLKRLRLGNPPGKKRVTIGDEVNWEALLKIVPDGANLYLVSDDGDYSSSFSPDLMNPFLVDEWKSKKKSDIFFFKNLQDLFQKNYPHIKLASDVHKALLISKLSTSGSFATTHLVVNELAKIEEFSKSEVEDLIQIADQNSQVRWIIGDADVLDFYKTLLDKHASKISQEFSEQLQGLFPVNKHSGTAEALEDIF